MRRRVARVVFVGLGTVAAAALGTVGALIGAAPGRGLLARLVSEQSNRLVRGSVAIARIDGDFRSFLALDSVVIRDTAGAVLADVPRLEVGFRLRSLLGKSFVFSGVRMLRPTIRIVKHRGGRMNYEEVLRLGEGPPGGPSRLLELQDLEIVEGRLEIRTPWNPDGRLRTARQKDSALAAQRGRPGRRIEPGPTPAEGLQQVRLIEDLTARIPVLTITSPDRKPLSARIDSLAARLSDPAIDLRALAGRITQGGDSLVFDLDQAALPGTMVRGTGRIDWPRDTILYDFALVSPHVDLVDLRWISPDFPALIGRGEVTAKSPAGSRAEFDIRNLHLADPTSRVDGRLVAITDVYRGFGVRDLDLELTDLDLEAVRPYLDTLPLVGRLTGPLQAAGFFDDMEVTFDWRFDDARVEGAPPNYVALSGQVRLGGPMGFGFEDAVLERSDLDLRTIRLLTPGVRLNGRLELAGRLRGPWRDVTFDGEVVHRDGERPASRARGTTRLDTRGSVLALNADVVLDTLAFDGLRGSFPAAPMRGAVRGPLRLDGDLSRLRVAADLRGQVGRFVARGWTTLQPPRWAAESLVVDFTNADLASLRGSGPATRLTGRLELTGRIDTAVAPEADVRLRTGAGRIRELRIDSSRVRLAIRDSLLTIDTARLWWEGAEATVGGSLGWFEPHRGQIRAEAQALALGALDSLAHGLIGGVREEGGDEAELSGRARARLTIDGSLDRWQLDASGRIDSLRWMASGARGATASLQWRGGRLETPTFSARAMIDSAAWGRYLLQGLTAEAAGGTARFRWAASAATPRFARASAGGWHDRREAERAVAIDSLVATVLERTWRLQEPARITERDSVTTVDPVVVAAADGSGLMRVAGELPGRAEGRLMVNAFGLELRDVYALLQRDTTGVDGRVAIDGRIEGTRRAPRFRGSGSVTGAVLGDFQAPLVRGVYNYEDRRLLGNLKFWRAGNTVLDVDVALPIDLGLADVPRRQIPGPLEIRARADSVDLAVVEAYTRNLRSVRGSARIDAQVGGAWDAPRLGGSIQLRDGSARVPALGVRYDRVSGAVRLAGDSLAADGLSLRSGDGDLAVTGAVRLEGLTRPVLGLTLEARDFLVIDVRDYLTLRARGEVTLTGPVARPVLTGQSVATNSVLYFSDLISKDIVNLEDPMNADLVDTTALRVQKLGAQFQSRFLDSLVIRDLRFQAGEGVWLRSNEANLQLEGRVTVNKDRWRPRSRPYRVSGELLTPRGTYTLKLGPVFRTFQVERGRLQYFNTADLDAALDVEARHVVRTVQGSGDDYPIIAKITGTLLAPKLALTTAADRAPLPEKELFSLLATGTFSNSILNQSFRGEDAALAVGSTVLSAELQRSLISDIGLPVDLVEIRPGFAQSGSAFATAGVTTLAVGRQISPRLFAILRAGACIGETLEFSYRYLGASVEYRFHPSLKFSLAAEPVQSCLAQTARAFATRSLYQFAADLRWDREY